MKTKEVLQSSFDLLGELMKFNSTGFKEFNDSITDAEVRTEQITFPSVNLFHYLLRMSANQYWLIIFAQLQNI